MSMEFSRHEYWSGLPCPVPGDLPTQGSNLRFLYLLHWWAGSLSHISGEDVSSGLPPQITQPKGDRSTFLLFCKKCFLSLHIGIFDLLTN